MSFALHPQLIKDCLGLGDLLLCRVLLMNNRHFPWIILVPRMEDASEITDLSALDRVKLMEEISFVSEALQKGTGAHKMNVAALGNQVPQLHVHVIGRFRDDGAWPDPVWGAATEPYDPANLPEYIQLLRGILGLTATA